MFSSLTLLSEWCGNDTIVKIKHYVAKLLAMGQTLVCRNCVTVFTTPKPHLPLLPLVLVKP